MATSVSWNGTSYSVPGTGEEDWGGNTKVDGLIISLAQNGFQKSGGTFELTGTVDFGGTAGLKALYWGSRGTNIASTGEMRLANTEGVYWRNAANSADLGLTVNASNQLMFNSVLVSTGAALTASRVMVTDASGYYSASSVNSTTLGYLDATSSIQTQLDAKLAKAGGTMTGVLAFAAGSAAAPSGTVDTTTGFYKKTTSSMGFAAAGTEIGFYDSAGLWTLGPLGNTSTSAVLSLLGRGVDLTYTRANTPAYIQISHTDNSSAAHANFYAYAKGGDAYITFDNNATTRFSFGIDISDSGALKISQSGTLGSTDIFRVDNTTLAFTIGNGTSSTHRLNTTVQTTVGAAGAASALPATPTGYVLISINGTNRAIPYYAAS